MSETHEPDSPDPETPRCELPPGIVQCPECGDFNGSTRAKYLSNWNNDDPDRVATVSCLCDGILCRICKKNKIHRPVSNYYRPEDNTVWHCPYFYSMAPCRECAEIRDRQRG